MKQHMLSENPWNRESRTIEVCGEFERSVYDHNGERLAIAVGQTAQQCMAHTGLILTAFDNEFQADARNIGEGESAKAGSLER